MTKSVPVVNSTKTLSGGLHGVGVSCVTPFRHLRANRDGKIHEQEYSRGKEAYAA